MQCSNCGAVNRATARFCSVCRTPLQQQQPLLPTQAIGLSQFLPQPSASSGPRLVVDSGQVYPLTAPVTTIGRDPACQITMSGGNISRRHAEIRQHGSDYILTDLGSSNGTFVNGRKLAGPCTLHPNDQLNFGGVNCAFQADAHIFAPPPAPNLPVPVQPQPHLTPSPAVTPPQVINQNRPEDILDWAKTRGGPTARGRVTAQPQEQSSQPPFDFARMLVMLWVALNFVAAIFTFIAVVAAVGIVLICLGGAALLFLLPLILIPIQMFFGGVMGWLKNDKPITMVTFRLDDNLTGRPVDVTFARKPASGGMINLGDRVEVWGKRSGDLIQARKVRVVESQGLARVVNVAVRRPWPLWVGLLPYLLSIIGWLLLASGGDIEQLLRSLGL